MPLRIPRINSEEASYFDRFRPFVKRVGKKNAGNEIRLRKIQKILFLSSCFIVHLNPNPITFPYILNRYNKYTFNDLMINDLKYEIPKISKVL